MYKRALIGGADHIIAHAAVGQIPHPCISKSFTDDIDDVIKWSKYFYTFTQAKVGYVPGDLYHIWHGDIKKRQYLKRIKDFTADSREIKEIEDDLYVSKNDLYVREYMRDREVFYDESFDFGDLIDDSFVGVMGYAITDVFNLFGPPFNEDQDSYVQPIFSESTIETQENFS